METSTHTHLYWQYEYDVSSRYMIPLLKEWGVLMKKAEVLDVGCGEGGGLCAMHDKGALCVGFDNDKDRINAAKRLVGKREIEFTRGDLYEATMPFAGKKFDLVVLHDVFEHLDHKEAMLEKLKRYLKAGGRIMITYPPYYSAYGAHQQHLKSSIAKLPFFHLVPWALSVYLPRLKGEHSSVIEEVTKLARNKMGMRLFERIVRGAGMSVAGKQAYFVSPNHIRFGLKPIPAGIVADVPFLSEFVCTGVVYLLSLQ